MVNTEKVSDQEGVLDIICITGFVLASRQTSPEFFGRQWLGLALTGQDQVQSLGRELRSYMPHNTGQKKKKKT